MGCENLPFSADFCFSFFLGKLNPGDPGGDILIA